MNSQKQKVLNWLIIHKELTTRTAVMELNIMSLPRRIMELRRDGYNIDMTYRKSMTGARYGVYTLREGGPLS
jgi:hypothetical protein